ncbi:hypothetical protein C2S51_037800 [Perilla frutescens var. frutescens]|nr:hypothetical protein C2S51_037800 [Perilla frutescens var. frutescens]
MTKILGFITVGIQSHLSSDVADDTFLKELQEKMYQGWQGEIMRRDAAEMKLQEKLTKLHTGMSANFKRLSNILDALQLQLIGGSKSKVITKDGSILGDPPPSCGFGSEGHQLQTQASNKNCVLTDPLGRQVTYPFPEMKFPKSEGFSPKTGLARPFSTEPAGNDVIGIDFGTTNSCVSVMEREIPKFIENSEGARIISSVEAFSPKGELLVGPPAKMNETDEAYLYKVVVTVPAYFNDAQQQATKDAERIAGLYVQRIINENTVVALSYGLNNIDVLIVVFYPGAGSGTFDVLILEISNGVSEVKGTINGDTFLGWKDVDNALLEFLMDVFKRTNIIDLSKDRLVLQRLREAAVEAKIELSSTSQIEINLPHITADASGPRHLNITSTRSKLEASINHLIERIKASCISFLKNAGILSKEADEVLIVGGIFTRLINRNTKITTKKSHTFSTAADNQPQVGIKVLQGEREMAIHNKFLGEFSLTGIPLAPRSLPQIEVMLDIDVNRFVTVSVKNKTTKSLGGLSGCEIKKMVNKTDSHAHKDQEMRALINLRNDADTTCYNLEKSLYKYWEKIPSEVASKIESAISDLRSTASIKNADDIKAKLDAANKVMPEIRQHMSGGLSGGSFGGSLVGNQAHEVEEIFSSDKENTTLNGNLCRSIKNIGSSQQVRKSNLQKPSPLKITSRSIYQEEVILPTLDCQIHKAPHECKASCYASKSLGNLRKQRHVMKIEKMLLRSLIGTSWVIHRIILRELDCLVRSASFLSRMIEASATLQWIEDCIVSTKCWVRVQSSVEEGGLILPALPIALARRFREDRGASSIGSIHFSPYSLQEIVTLTAADHILESALFFKQTMNEQLVLLSDDVTLKIKAMAEGEKSDLISQEDEEVLKKKFSTIDSRG